MPRPRYKERYEVEWQELTKGAVARRAADEHYDHDHDRDEQSIYEVFPVDPEEPKAALAAARKRAREIVDSAVTVYGCATVTHQRYLPIEDTIMWEWEDVGEAEYVE